MSRNLMTVKMAKLRLAGLAICLAPLCLAGTAMAQSTTQGAITGTVEDATGAVVGSATVKINGKPAARNGDKALTCNDPADLAAGTVIAVGSVLIG